MLNQQRIRAALLVLALGAAIALAATARLVLAQPESHSCPMMDRAGRPEMTVTVQRDAQGATLKLMAKSASDAAKVQQFAEHLAQHMTEGCPMHGSKQHMHGKPMRAGHKGAHHGPKP